MGDNTSCTIVKNSIILSADENIGNICLQCFVIFEKLTVDRICISILIGYVHVINIPKGARNIIISNDNLQNYLALKNLNGFYYLNGDYTVEPNIIGKIESRTAYNQLTFCWLDI